MSRPLVGCSEQMWTADAEEVELLGKATTILCDMLAAWKLLEVLSSMDFNLLDAEVWTDLAAIPLRVKMSSKTMDVLLDIHMEDSRFHHARREALANAREPMQRCAVSSAEDTVSVPSLETDGSDEKMIRLTGLGGRLVGTERVHLQRTTRARAGA